MKAIYIDPALYPTVADLRRIPDERAECTLAKRCVHDHDVDTCFYAAGEEAS